MHPGKGLTNQRKPLGSSKANPFRAGTQVAAIIKVKHLTLLKVELILLKSMGVIKSDVSLVKLKDLNNKQRLEKINSAEINFGEI